MIGPRRVRNDAGEAKVVRRDWIQPQAFTALKTEPSASSETPIGQRIDHRTSSEGGRQTFDPFGKPIAELQELDLERLITNQVAEGYYVEYKSTLPPTGRKVGQSIAALANTYGGWYVVGVITDAHNVAKAIPGVSPVQLPDPVAKIRDLIRAHVDPTPVFTTRIVALRSGALVAVVHVPDEQDGPFISSDGRIYRRTADSSEPVAENNRYVIDQLYERGERARKRFAQLRSDDRAFSKAEDEQAWVRIYLSPYPYGSINRPEIVFAKGMEDLLAQTSLHRPLFSSDDLADALKASLPLDHIHPTPHSVVMEQGFTISRNGLAVELFVDGRVRMLIPVPLRVFPAADLSVLRSAGARRIVQRALQSATGDGQLLRFVDLGQLSLVTGSLLTWYLAWLGDSAPIDSLETAIELDGVWRHVPFGDTDEWAAYVERFGLPVLRQDQLSVPFSPGRSLRVDLRRPAANVWLEVARLVGQAFGLTAEAGAQLLIDTIKRRTETTAATTT